MFKMENRNYDLRVNASYEVPEFRPSDGVLRPSRFKALLLYLIVAAGLLFASTVTSVLQAIWPDMTIWQLQTVTCFVYYPLACVLPVFIFLKVQGKGSIHALRPNPVRFRTVLFSVLLAIVCMFFANNLTALWGLPFDALGFNIYAGSAPMPETIGQLMLAVLTVGVMPGACEELVFRGFMQPAFEEKGTKRAAIFVSLLFALLHGSIIGFPAQFILGLIMAVLIIVTDSIYASAIFHTVYNSALMVLGYFQAQAGMTGAAPGELFAEIGGIIGVATALMGVMMLAAPIFFMLFSLSRRAKNSGFRAIEKQKMRLRGGEIGVLIGGLSLVLIYYVLDFLMMAGVLM